MTTKMFGAPVQRKEDPRLLTGNGRYLDDLGHDALAAAFVRSPHAHARILDIDVTDALDVEGVVGDLHPRGPRRQGGRAAAAADPAPDADQRRRPATPWPREWSTTSASRWSWSSRPTATSPRTPASGSGSTTSSCPSSSASSAPATADVLVHDDVPGNVAAHMVQEVGDADAAIAGAPHTLTLVARDRAQRLHPDGGQGRLRPLGPRRGVAAALLLHPDHHRCAGGRRGQARSAPGQGRVHRPRRRRRLRRQDHAPVARGGPGAVGRPPAGRARSSGSRTGASTSSPPRTSAASCRRSRSASTTRAGCSASTSSSGTTTAPTRRTASSSRSSPRPSCSGPTSPAPTGASSPRCYTNTVIVTPYRGAGRPQGVFAMERTMDAIADYLGLDRADVRSANFIQPDEMPYDHGLLFQDGRPLIYDSGDFPASLDKLKELVGWDDFAAYRAEAESRGPAGRARHRLLRRGHRRRPLRGRPHPGRDLRPGQRLDRADHARARATRPCSRRSSPRSSACGCRTSTSPRATPAGSVTPWARSPPARR